MDAYKIRVGKNGRITIPIEIRRKLNLKTGDLLIIEHVENGRIVLRKATPDEKLTNALSGSLPKR